jgi:hypothetical protein
MNDTPTEITLDFSVSDARADTKIRARFFKLKIEDRGATKRWKLSGISFYGFLVKGRMP